MSYKWKSKVRVGSWRALHPLYYKFQWIGTYIQCLFTYNIVGSYKWSILKNILNKSYSFIILRLCFERTFEFSGFGSEYLKFDAKNAKTNNKFNLFIIYVSITAKADSVSDKYIIVL